MTNPSLTFSASRWRSLAGLAAALLVFPLVLGNDSCYVLKTPIGDPDHAWADPRISGVWISAGLDVPKEYSADLWMFEPYDAKTWLVTTSEFSDRGNEATTTEDAGAPASAANQNPAPAPATHAGPKTSNAALDVPGIMKTLTEPRAVPEGVVLYKGWAVSLAGRRFLVLEPRAEPSSKRGFRPGHWFVFAADLKDGRLVLSGLDSHTEKLGETKTRAQAEAIITRHAADPKFTEVVLILHRVPRDAYDDAGKAMSRAMAR